MIVATRRCHCMSLPARDRSRADSSVRCELYHELCLRESDSATEINRSHETVHRVSHRSRLGGTSEMMTKGNRENRRLECDCFELIPIMYGPPRDCKD